MTEPRSTYAYNPACTCEWCRNGGENRTPEIAQQGGSYGYGDEHNPPGSKPPWARKP